MCIFLFKSEFIYIFSDYGVLYYINLTNTQQAFKITNKQLQNLKIYK